MQGEGLHEGEEEGKVCVERGVQVVMTAAARGEGGIATCSSLLLPPPALAPEGTKEAGPAVASGQQLMTPSGSCGAPGSPMGRTT